MKITKKPLVTIVIPVFNGANYVKEAIKAALNQTYDNIQVIIVNDGSNDNGETARAINSISDKRILVINKKNGGISSALNSALEVADGEYISWLSHDDLYKENKIKHQVDFILSHKKYKVIPYCKTVFVDKEGKRIFKLSLQASVRRTINIKNSPFGATFNGCSLLLPKQALKNGFDIEFRYIQDTIKWYELLKDGYVFKCSGHSDSLMRIHEQTVTNKHPELYEKEYKIFYAKVRKGLAEENKFGEIIKSTKSLALMCKKYPFYEDLINDNFKILSAHQKISKIVKLSINIRKMLSRLLFR